MQWVLQDFEDMRKLAGALQRADLPHSWHKVVPFVGDLHPAPDIPDRDDVILMGSYTLWRYAEREGLSPGVFRIRPFLHEVPWRPHMLNGAAEVMRLRDVARHLPGDDAQGCFMRPVSDAKEVAGGVRSAGEIREMATKALSLPPEDIPVGALTPDTEILLAPAARILAEWRLWVVADRVVTWSLYVDGGRVTYRAEIADDALAFAEALVAANPGYAPAYVMDVCRTPDGLRLLETNCLNAAGFYAADLDRLVDALEALRA